MTTMKKVLVTGSEGMLGNALMHSLTQAGFLAEGVDIRSKANRVNITARGDVINAIKRTRPDIVIHTAAYTDVDGCELNPGKAYLVNTEGSKNVAEACNEANTLLIFMSTDYVFDGEKTTAYNEEDKPNPINVYGSSKLKGENLIKEIMPRHLIIRTSWLFGGGGRNFVDTIIDRTKAGEELKIVNDQFGSPTYRIDLAEAITYITSSSFDLFPSTLNITNSGSCSWYEFAKEILKAAGLDTSRLEKISSEELNRPARRPKMSMLDTSTFRKVTGKTMPLWQDALTRYLKEAQNL